MAALPVRADRVVQQVLTGCSRGVFRWNSGAPGTFSRPSLRVLGSCPVFLVASRPLPLSLSTLSFSILP